MAETSHWIQDMNERSLSDKSLDLGRPRGNNSQRPLVLFDVDGTLVNTGGMGSQALSLAFWELYEIEDALDGIRLHGKTDGAIIREIFRQHGVHWTTIARDEVLAVYLEHLRQEAKDSSLGSVCPGILPLLEELHGRDDCAIGLLTGNIERGAEVKLRAFGLWRYFSFGAYGSDRLKRSDLVEVAVLRAREMVGWDFVPGATFVVGDTPADIQAARNNDCFALAVATGGYTRGELQRCKPDWLFSDLGDLPKVLDVLGLPGSPREAGAGIGAREASKGRA